MEKVVRLALGLVAFSLIAAAAIAQGSVPLDAPPGSGVLGGAARLQVKHCRSSSTPLTVGFALAGDGAWTADAPAAIGGPSTTKLKMDVFYDRLRVRTRLALSAASLGALQTLLAGEATALCGESVSVSAVRLHRGTLALDKRWTHARLRLSIDAQGVSAGGPRKVRYRIDALGPWTPE